MTYRFAIIGTNLNGDKVHIPFDTIKPAIEWMVGRVRLNWELYPIVEKQIGGEWAELEFADSLVIIRKAVVQAAVDGGDDFMAFVKADLRHLLVHIPIWAVAQLYSKAVDLMLEDMADGQPPDDGKLVSRV